MEHHDNRDGMNRRTFLRLTAAAGLVAGPEADWLFAAIDSATVTGTVYGGRAALAGVRVSDGRNVVKTDAMGRFSLEVGTDSGPFLFVTTPPGFWTDRFFVPTAKAARAGRADFHLDPQPGGNSFRFVFWTDMHLEKGGVSIEKFRRTVAETNSHRPDFVWAQGDICLQGKAGRDYLACSADLNAPIRNGAGNHEMILAAANPRARFETLFGPTYYSFDWGSVHCVVLDGNKVTSQDDHWSSVHGLLSERELAWLAADLAAKPAGMPVIVGIHIPLVTTYSQRRGSPPKGVPPWIVGNEAEVRKLLEAHDTRLVLQGHLHENERTTLNGIEYVTSQAIGGSWWQSSKGFERGVDHAPRGYRIVDVEGTTISHRFVSSCESHVDAPGELAQPAARVTPRKKTWFVYNCYDAPNDAHSKARVDEGAWQKMIRYPALNQGLHLIMPHHYLLDVDTTKLTPGGHALEIETTSTAASFRHRVELTVDAVRNRKIPLIYSTDLFHPHDDPDDHFDIATIFAIPEIDLKAVILDDGAQQKQRSGRVAVEQLMAITGKSVPIAAGLAPRLESPGDAGKTQSAAQQAGVDLILKTLQQSDSPVTIVAVGSLRDIAAAYNRDRALCGRKIERLYAFCGDAHSDPHFKFREWNVTRDVNAYIAIMQSGLPVYWVPCFDGGAWQNAGNASFWQASHQDLLAGVTDRVKQYFIHALLKTPVADPLAILSKPVDQAAWQKVLASQRNLWCAAVFTHLVDRTIVKEDGAWHSLPYTVEVRGQASPPFTFEKVLVSADPTGMALYPKQLPHYLVERFKVTDPATYPRAMTELTAELLAGLGSA
jgi:UDP-2,3-diacylglucosamine pyrophosphatase LpxH